jgi:hypothetical protein
VRNQNIPSSYPYPDLREPKVSPADYDALCINWARRLTEGNLRALASDYMRGIRDESTEDAFEEYKRRERLGLLSDQKSEGQSLKTSKRRAR